jgi:hypothetical protein
LLAAPASALAGAVVIELRRLPVDAFLAMAFWQFARTFPTESQHALARRIADASFVTAAAVGVLLFAVNLFRIHQSIDPAARGLGLLLDLFDRNQPALGYWPLLFAVAAPAVPYLVWKSRFETLEERRRVVFFVLAIMAGVTPMLLAVIATPLVPALHDPGLRRWLGWILYGALVSVVLSTGYAVLVHRVVDIDLIVRKTMQHALARYAVWMAIVAPLAYLGWEVYVHRELTLAQFIRREQPVGIVLFLLLGLGALTFREELLLVVDRWFLRGPVDYAEALARVEHGCRSARSVREIAALLVQEIDRAIHPSRAAVLVINQEGDRFEPIDAAVAPLNRRSALVEILRSVGADIQLAARSDSPVMKLLPKADQEWLSAGGFTLLSPLLGSTDALLGIIVLGESRGGLLYTKQDRMFVGAVSGQTAMLLENRWLRELSGDEHDVGRGARPRIIDWDNEPGVYCPQCWRMSAVSTFACSCGVPTKAAALPLIVKGKFRVERLIGFGGMGVVYLAVDLALDRKVAIKTLPNMTPERALRLQREARAMASVLHPNLALIFGAEHWRGTPLLVVEYLERGTLSDVIGRGPLALEEVLDLGVVLADALDRVHGSGVLHRDIKPSNIGYTRDGNPKLLDFGLAAILDRSQLEERRPPFVADAEFVASALADSQPGVTLSVMEHLVGTPLYLSPEALAGQPPQPSFDLWSLSLVLYEALTRHHPFNDTTVPAVLERIRQTRVPDVRDFQPQCPSSVAALFNDALSPVVARRPATAADLRARLRRLASDLGPLRG